MDNMNSTASKRHVDPWMVAIGTVFTGELISILTSAIAQMGLIWHIIMVTHSPLSTTLATLVGFIPTALLGPFAGVFVDRLPLKAVLIGADLSIAREYPYCCTGYSDAQYSGLGYFCYSCTALFGTGVPQSCI